MMSLRDYYKGLKPTHILADKQDFVGNDDAGRYVILCGSKKRCEIIASYLDDIQVKDNPRGHTLFLGTLASSNQDQKNAKIDVAIIPTGMGCPSIDIILHELLMLGAKRFLRVGTAGSLQTHVKVGDIVIATGAVRDEHTSENYVSKDYPAIASWEMLHAIQHAAVNSVHNHLHYGVVHTKDSFYARENNLSFLKENQAYMEHLTMAGVLASEMECSHLFILTALANYFSTEGLKFPHQKVISGAILAIVGEKKEPINMSEKAEATIQQSILLALETIKYCNKISGKIL